MVSVTEELFIDPVILLLASSNVGPGVPIMFPDESYHVITKSVFAPEVNEMKYHQLNHHHNELHFQFDPEIKEYLPEF